jgi:endoglucanase
MRLFLNLPLIRRGMAFLTIGLLMSVAVMAQTWPTALQEASQMTIGWNIGNSLESTGGETAWGNPAITQQLINAVKAAGFNAIRIPCAWDSHADASTHVIDAAWLARVKEVVDYCMNNSMYVIINIHWDGGWLEEHPLYSYQASVNEKQQAYWTQIASYFKSYDSHLLFAGTNEVHADYGTPTAEHIKVQESYNQTFVDAVRATGGNNTNRNLIVQTYNTNMWHGLDYFTMPTDVVNNHLFVEVHYYDPYDFTLNTSGSCLYWGSPYPEQSACNWAQENYVNDLFAQVKAKWPDNGIPVIMGEYGVIKRTSLSGQQLIDHIASREYYLEYITDAAVNIGMTPFTGTTVTMVRTVWHYSTGIRGLWSIRALLTLSWKEPGLVIRMPPTHSQQLPTVPAVLVAIRQVQPIVEEQR